MVASLREEFELLTGKEATIKNVLSGMHAAQLIHIATHLDAGENSAAANAPINGSALHFSGLVMSPSESGHLLSAARIAKTRLSNCRLAFCNACESAGAVRVPGDHVCSVQWAFRLAGAKTVIGAIWPVEDRQAQLVARTFYRYLLDDGMSAAQAMQQTQNDLISEYPGVASWCVCGDHR